MAATNILITGACGEVGHSLIETFALQKDVHVVGLDLRLPPSHHAPNVELLSGNILDAALMEGLFSKYRFSRVFHLAAVLSSSGERDPFNAHRVNVEGSLQLLRLSREAGLNRGSPTTFIFPSTIAVYGLPSSETKRAAGKVSEQQFLSPITMYGINKLYVENMGRYFCSHFGLLLGGEGAGDAIDFRCVRFPGLLSADSVPSGGTSDYGPEMIHAAAQGKAYRCFVPADARLPFLAMPDAVQCLLDLAQAPRQNIKQSVYNINGFSISAGEIREKVLQAFPKANIGFEINQARYKIVESWPAEVDESPASRDWGWNPRYSKDTTFSEYLIPHIRRRYENKPQPSPSCGSKSIGASHV